MMPMKEWFRSVDKSIPDEELATKKFFHDPVRPMVQDESCFFSPADGIVIYAERNDGGKMFDVKGKAYRVEDLCQMSFSVPVIVIGIFMTRWDVHVNRVPITGHLKYKRLPVIRTKNMPMIEEEDDLLHGRIDKSAFGYLFNNERVLNYIYAPCLGIEYYIVQIADYDVDTITPFNTDQNVQVKQNNRFSMIRWGSQVDLVVPVVPQFDYEILVPPKFHVEGAVDRLIRITPSAGKRRDDRFDVLRRK
jgi:phosphatidylserine decarboxylase